MSFDDAMHTKCEACGKQAQFHRMTTNGNFYCLIPKPFSYAAAALRQRGAEDGLLYLQNQARANELQKSPLSKRVAETIKAGLTTFVV